MRKSPITGHEEEFEQMLKSNVPNQDIAKHFGCSRDHIRYFANRHGMKTSRQITYQRNTSIVNMPKTTLAMLSWFKPVPAKIKTFMHYSYDCYPDFDSPKPQ